MTRAIRTAALFAVLAAGALLAPGCGSNSDCNVTPDLSTAPGSCTLAPSSPVTVSVRWCSCGATTTCQVTDEGGGVFQLEPKVNSCDASCPTNPAGCDFDTVQCRFTTPAAGGDYHLYIIDPASANGFRDVSLTVAGSDITCI